MYCHRQGITNDHRTRIGYNFTNCALVAFDSCTSCVCRTFRTLSIRTMDPPPLFLMVLLASVFFRIAEACSTRSTPKPRPPTPTARPNITFQTYPCPDAYAKWYCLNGATCFSVKIGESILYNCECADGYVGQRCEFKDLDGSYLPSRESILIERASIAGGVTLAVIIIVVLSIAAYVYVRRKRKQGQVPRRITIEDLERKPFGNRYPHLYPPYHHHGPTPL